MDSGGRRLLPTSTERRSKGELPLEALAPLEDRRLAAHLRLLLPRSTELQGHLHRVSEGLPPPASMVHHLQVTADRVGLVDPRLLPANMVPRPLEVVLVPLLGLSENLLPPRTSTELRLLLILEGRRLRQISMVLQPLGALLLLAVSVGLLLPLANTVLHPQVLRTSQGLPPLPVNTARQVSEVVQTALK